MSDRYAFSRSDLEGAAALVHSQMPPTPSYAWPLLAAKAGASFISPFVGRHDDVGYPGMELIADIRLVYDNYDFATEILVASVRNPIHVHEAAKIGADVMTAPPSVIRQLFRHPLTDAGLTAFLADWEKTGQKIG